MTIRLPVLASSIFAAFVLNIKPVYAGWEEDLFRAQECLNKAEGRNTMHCMRFIQGHDTVEVRGVKCAIWLLHHGYNWLNSPILTFDTEGETMLMVMHGFTDFDIPESYANEIAFNCEGAVTRYRNGKYRQVEKLIGGKYIRLKSYLLSFASFDTKGIVINASSIQDQNIILKIEKTLRELMPICRDTNTDALLPIHTTAWCAEVLKLRENQNVRLFDSFIASLR